MQIINPDFGAYDASWWDRFYARGFHSFNEFDRRKFEAVYPWIRDGESVIDFGFGEGYFFDALPGKENRKLGAVDWSEKAIAKGKAKYPDAEFWLRDLEKPLDIKAKYDVGVCCEVLEHLKDPKNLIDGMKKVCKRLVITLPDEDNCKKFADDDKPLLRAEFKEGELDYHYASYTKEDLRAMFGGKLTFIDHPRHIIAFYEG